MRNITDSTFRAKEALAPLANAFSYSVDDATRMVGLPRTTIYDLMAQGEIAFFHCGRRRLIDGDSLRAFLARQKPAATLRHIPRATAAA